VHEIGTLSERLVHGVRSDALSIARLRVRGLGRALIRRLLRAGLADPDALREASEDVVRRALNHRGAFARLREKLQSDTPPAEPQRYPVVADAGHLMAAEPIAPYGEEVPAEPPAPLLIVNLRERRVTYRGHEIPTRPTRATSATSCCGPSSARWPTT